jgi:hypothetical protein
MSLTTSQRLSLRRRGNVGGRRTGREVGTVGGGTVGAVAVHGRLPGAGKLMVGSCVVGSALSCVPSVPLTMAAGGEGET